MKKSITTKARKISAREKEKRLQNRKASLKTFIRAAYSWYKFYLELFQSNPDAVETAISRKNSKIGNIYNISLVPILSCGHMCHAIGCALYCYARYSVLGGGGYNGSTMKAWCRNLVQARYNPEKYFSDVVKAMRKAAKTDLPLFRWHVGGEILDYNYLLNMAICAKTVRNCRSLCFTTRYDLVRQYLNEYGAFPENLVIILSAGPDGKPVPGFENLPCTTIILKGSDVPDYVTYRCPGKCELCKQHCWFAKPGECIGFDEH